MSKDRHKSVEKDSNNVQDYFYKIVYWILPKDKKDKKTVIKWFTHTLLDLFVCAPLVKFSEKDTLIYYAI